MRAKTNLTNSALEWEAIIHFTYEDILLLQRFFDSIEIPELANLFNRARSIYCSQSLSLADKTEALSETRNEGQNFSHRYIQKESAQFPYRDILGLPYNGIKKILLIQDVFHVNVGRNAVFYFGPHYTTRSNGVCLGYEFVSQLVASGHPALYICWEPRKLGEPFPDKYLHNTYFIDGNQASIDLPEDAIAIYTDVVEGNPLNAKKIVRYLMNKPQFLGSGELQYFDSEYLIAYSKLVDSELPQAFFMIDDSELFTRVRSKAKLDTYCKERKVSIYLGKVNLNLINGSISFLKEVVKRFDRVNVITRNIPDTREEMLESMLNSELLISYDPLTNLNYEATLLGVPVLLMGDTYSILGGGYTIPLYGFFSDFTQFENARIEVPKAFPYYQEYVNSQNTGCEKIMVQIMEHFQRIDLDEVYQKENQKRNKAQKKKDGDLFIRQINKEPFVNIEYFDDLPEKIQKVLKKKLSTEDLSSILRPSLGQ